MTIMISTGIMLRRMQLVDPDLLNTFYIGMGIPLVISALRFFLSWYREINCRAPE